MGVCSFLIWFCRRAGTKSLCKDAAEHIQNINALQASGRAERTSHSQEPFLSGEMDVAGPSMGDRF